MKTFIYILLDPHDGVVKYVGKTNNPRQRLSNHIKESKRCNNHRACWIKSLANKGVQPILEVIDIVPQSEWEFWERHYISLYRSWGFNLVNATDGGDGLNNPSVETRKKMSDIMKKQYMEGYRKSPSRFPSIRIKIKNTLLKNYKDGITLMTQERRDKIAASLVGKSSGDKNPMFGRKGILSPMFGKTHSVQTRKKLSEQKLGNKNPRFGKHDFKYGKGKHFLQYDTDGNFIKKFISSTELTDAGFVPQNVRRCCKKVTKHAHGFVWKFEN